MKLDELQRLAEEGYWMSDDTAKKLIAVARAAITIAECKSADPNRGRSNEGRWTTINALAADFEALRTALEELK